uniref:Cation/H+ exchanger domain-containing protein n=1 Tax=Panagrolaimus sp. ES5 TaxID=591445 RepID=A0AC34F5E3_9BILA
MLELQTKTYGIDQGIPTLINAAASIDDVYAITWFSLILSSITSGAGKNDNNLSAKIWTIAQAPIEVFTGISMGCILGGILWIFPSPELKNIKIRRMTLLFSFSSAALFGMDYLGYKTVGPFAVLVLGFIAALYWSKEEKSKILDEEEILKNEWKYFGLPLLFCLIGYQLDLHQAALAPVLMDLVQRNPAKFGRFKSEATIILTVTILSILITAPVGAILIRLLGPLMLQKSKTKQSDVNEILLN